MPQADFIMNNYCTNLSLPSTAEELLAMPVIKLSRMGEQNIGPSFQEDMDASCLCHILKFDYFTSILAFAIVQISCWLAVADCFSITIYSTDDIILHFIF